MKAVKMESIQAQKKLLTPFVGDSVGLFEGDFDGLDVGYETDDAKRGESKRVSACLR